MVKKGEKGIPRSEETRKKIGIGARQTRLNELRPCDRGCSGLFNSGNLESHRKKYHTFSCSIPQCPITIHKGLGYCGSHYRLSVFCQKLGISIEEYFDAYDKQKGLCRLCGAYGEIQASGHEKSKSLAIDHCHTSGKFRGLLCFRCNLALGQFKDDTVVLERAVLYLKGDLPYD